MTNAGAAQTEGRVEPLGQFVKGMRQGEELKRVYRFARSLLIAAFNLAAMQADVWLHTRLGERYLTWFAAALSAALVGAYAALLAEPGLEFQAAVVWAAGFVCMVAWRRAAMWLLARSGERWHSYSVGAPWRLWGYAVPGRGKDWVVYQVVEPAIVLGAGLAVWFGAGLGVGLCVAGVAAAMWARASLLRAQAKAAVLDLVDSQIEAQHRSGALSGAPARETEGFAVPGAGRWTKRDRLAVDEAIARLSAEHRAMLDGRGPVVEPRVPAAAGGATQRRSAMASNDGEPETRP